MNQMAYTIQARVAIKRRVRHARDARRDHMAAPHSWCWCREISQLPGARNAGVRPSLAGQKATVRCKTRFVLTAVGHSSSIVTKPPPLGRFSAKLICCHIDSTGAAGSDEGQRKKRQTATNSPIGRLAITTYLK